MLEEVAAGKNVNQANLTDKSLLAEHRHRVDDKNNSMRVVLVTQDLAQISSWVRLLIETTYRIRKITKKTFKVDIYNGAVTGDAPSKTKLIRSTAGTFKSSVYSFYKSATQSNSGGVGDESSADGRSSILRSFGLWGALGSFVVCIVLGVFFCQKVFYYRSTRCKASGFGFCSKTIQRTCGASNFNNMAACWLCASFKA